MISDDNAAEFHQWVLHWRDELNLASWRIEAGHKKAQPDALAEIECRSADRLAVYRLGHWKGEHVDSQWLSSLALHEVLHVFLFDLIDQARDPRVSDSALDATEHGLINVLGGLLCPHKKSPTTN